MISNSEIEYFIVIMLKNYYSFDLKFNTDQPYNIINYDNLKFKI